MTILTGFVLWPLRKERLIKARAAALEQHALDKKIEYYPGASAAVMNFGLMSLAELKQVKNREYRNIVVSDDWQYCDFSYKEFQKTKYGEYQTGTIYYAVMTTRLPRALPNVFFDSFKARKRQFRFHFSHNQRHSLEVDFDEHFVTYFPEYYAIDSMSFISPDVMEALIAADDYDIEIVNDRIYIFGELTDPLTQMYDMSHKLERIKKQLLDNILTYRDERLPYAEGRQRVSVQGVILQRSKLVEKLSFAIFILFVFYYIVTLVVQLFINFMRH